jgi:hypothetical protein
LAKIKDRQVFEGKDKAAGSFRLFHPNRVSFFLVMKLSTDATIFTNSWGFTTLMINCLSVYMYKRHMQYNTNDDLLVAKTIKNSTSVFYLIMTYVGAHDWRSITMANKWLCISKVIECSMQPTPLVLVSKPVTVYVK